MNFVSYDFLFPSFMFVLEFWVCFEHSTHTPRCLTPAPRFFVSGFWVCYRVLVFLIDLSRCSKKKFSFSILILISKFLRQMRYRWNRHHSYIVNIVFLNNLVQNQTFFMFCIFVFITYKDSSLGRIFLDRLYKSQRNGTTFLTACASANLNFEGGWPCVQVECAHTTVVARKENLDPVCKRGSKLPGPKNPKGKFWPCVEVQCTDRKSYKRNLGFWLL